MELTDHVIWREGDYALIEGTKPGVIKAFGQQMQNCLSHHIIHFSLESAKGTIRLYALSHKTKLVVIFSLVRIGEHLFVDDMRARKNHLLNASEPFYPYAIAAVHALEEMFDERILMPVYPDANAAMALPVTSNSAPHFHHALLHAQCEALQPNPYKLVWTRVVAGDAHLFIQELVRGETLAHFDADTRSKLVTAIIPFVTMPGYRSVGAYRYEFADIVS